MNKEQLELLRSNADETPRKVEKVGKGILGWQVAIILFPFRLVWFILRAVLAVLLFPFGGWRRFKSSGDDGTTGVEKKLEDLSAEELAVHKRMQRRNQTWRAVSRSILLYSTGVEVLVSAAVFITLRSSASPLAVPGEPLFAPANHTVLRILVWRWAVFFTPILVVPAVIVCLYSLCARLVKARDGKDRKLLEKLRDQQRNQIEELKKQTNFYRTLELIKRYDKDVAKAAQLMSSSPALAKAPLPRRPWEKSRTPDNMPPPEAPGVLQHGSVGKQPGQGAVSGDFAQVKARLFAAADGNAGRGSGGDDPAGAGTTGGGLAAAAGVVKKKTGPRLRRTNSLPSNDEILFQVEVEAKDTQPLGATRSNEEAEGNPDGPPPLQAANELSRPGVPDVHHGAGPGFRTAQGLGSGAAGHRMQQPVSGRKGWWHRDSMLGRLAGLLVGETPEQCYALICKRCYAHNGLSRPEDFPFVAYFCPSCSFFNEAPGLSKTDVQAQAEKSADIEPSNECDVVIASKEKAEFSTLRHRKADGSADGHDSIISEGEVLKAPATVGSRARGGDFAEGSGLDAPRTSSGDRQGMTSEKSGTPQDTAGIAQEGAGNTHDKAGAKREGTSEFPQGEGQSHDLLETAEDEADFKQVGGAGSAFPGPGQHFGSWKELGQAEAASKERLLVHANSVTAADESRRDTDGMEESSLSSSRGASTDSLGTPPRTASSSAGRLRERPSTSGAGLKSRTMRPRYSLGDIVPVDKIPGL